MSPPSPGPLMVLDLRAQSRDSKALRCQVCLGAGHSQGLWEAATSIDPLVASKIQTGVGLVQAVAHAQ